MSDLYLSEMLFSAAGSIGSFMAAGVLWLQHRWFHRSFGKADIDDFRSRREALWRAKLGFAFFPASLIMLCMAFALGFIALAIMLEFRTLVIMGILCLISSSGFTVWTWKEFDRPSPRRHWPAFAMSLRSELRR